MTILEKIFSAKNTFYYKDITILGKNFRFINTNNFKLKIKLPKLISEKSIYNKTLLYLEIFSNLNFGTNDDLEGENYQRDYERLTNNLDSESRANIDFAINMRKNSILLSEQSDKNPKDLINSLSSNVKPIMDAEKEVLTNFSRKIKKTDNNLFKYENYLLPVNHFETSVFYYRHSIDELKTLNKVKNKNIIDVGGFIGDSAIIFSQYTDKNVYSFEASRENYEILTKTLEINKTKNVIPINMALGDKVSETLAISGTGSCKTTSLAVCENSEKITSTTLDSYAAEHNIEIGLIKVDIEGYEQHFLKGAENTIKEQKPALLISIYHNFDDYMHIKPMIEAWNLGYTFRIIKPKESLLLETLLVAEVLEK